MFQIALIISLGSRLHNHVCSRLGSVAADLGSRKKKASVNNIIIDLRRAENHAIQTTRSCNINH